jgi:hypothetical protein
MTVSTPGPADERAGNRLVIVPYSQPGCGGIINNPPAKLQRKVLGV